MYGVVWREQASGGEREESGPSGAETSSEQPVARRDKAFDDSRPRRMEAVAVSYRHTKGQESFRAFNKRLYSLSLFLSDVVESKFGE